jgi:zinc protease
MSNMDRNRVPEAGPLRAFEFPAVDRRSLVGGLDLRVARTARLPIVSASLFVRAGESALTDGRAGLSVLAGDALEGGSRRRSGSELAESLERIGARLDVATGWEGTSVSVSCLAERLAEALEILAETLLEPEFPAAEVARARGQALAAIRQRAMDPASLASDAATRRYFADGVPFARPLEGTRATVEPLGRNHVRGYAEAFYRPVKGGLIVVGDVDADEIEALTASCFEGWEGEPPGAGDFPVEPRTRERAVLVVDRPGSVQSEVRVGHVGLERSHPDVFALTVLNTLLGGAFTSRLNLNLRERHGYTYGVRSRFVLRARPGYFQVGTAVGTEVTAPAVGEILGELEAIATDGPTSEEIEASRDYIAGVFPLRLETAGQVAARVAELLIYGLPDDYHATYRDRIRGVTVEDASAAGSRHIRPSEVQVVVVGDADSVVKPLENLGIGPVEVASAQG